MVLTSSLRADVQAMIDEDRIALFRQSGVLSHRSTMILRQAQQSLLEHLEASSIDEHSRVITQHRKYWRDALGMSPLDSLFAEAE